MDTEGCPCSSRECLHSGDSLMFTTHCHLHNQFNLRSLASPGGRYFTDEKTRRETERLPVTRLLAARAADSAWLFCLLLRSQSAPYHDVLFGHSPRPRRSWQGSFELQELSWFLWSSSWSSYRMFQSVFVLGCNFPLGQIY